MISHFGVKMLIVHIDGRRIVHIGKCVEARHRSNVALIPVIVWKDLVKLLRVCVGLVVAILLGRMGIDIGAAKGISLLSTIFCAWQWNFFPGVLS